MRLPAVVTATAATETATEMTVGGDGTGEEVVMAAAGARRAVEEEPTTYLPVFVVQSMPTPACEFCV